VWGSACGGTQCDNIVWGDSGENDNIVWGDACGGGDCDNIVWGDSGDDNIVWGSGSGSDDNIVWGDGAADNVLWRKSVKPQTDLPVWTGPLPGETWIAGSGDLPPWLTDEMLFDVVIVAPPPAAHPAQQKTTPTAPVADPIVVAPAPSTQTPAGSSGGV
jgi:hypothetical protein